MKKWMLLIGVVVGSVSVQAEMLINRDFELGNQKFDSDYTQSTQIDVDGDGFYDVATTVPGGWAPGFGDHTSGSGNMLLVNAHTDSAMSFWNQTVDLSEVIAGETLTFSGWVATLTMTPLPEIELQIGGIQRGTFSVADQDDTWQKFTFTWRVPDTMGSVVFSLHDLTAAATGDDFAVDDLSLAVPEPATASMMALVGGLGFLIRRHFMS